MKKKELVGSYLQVNNYNQPLLYEIVLMNPEFIQSVSLYCQESSIVYFSGRACCSSVGILLPVGLSACFFSQNASTNANNMIEYRA